MLTVIAILATSLSSPYLGTFFEVPGWMGQASVASDRTYGSPDATNATHRIDVTALRAVNAIFEGFAERCYYTHAGPSNDWDVATYGPLAESRFWFAVPQNPDDHSYDIWHPWFVWRPDTNRVANAGTRRFVEYEHLQGLAGTLARPGPGYELEYITNIERPNWRHLMSGYAGGAVRFSSTLFDRFSQNPLPTFDWSAPGEVLTPRDWGEAALDWHFAANPENTDDEFSWKFVDGSEVADVIANHMLNDLSWGEPPSVASYCPQVWTNVTDTTEQIISKPYDIWNKWKEDAKVVGETTAEYILVDHPPSFGLDSYVAYEIVNHYGYDPMPSSFHVSAVFGEPLGFYWWEGRVRVYAYCDEIVVSPSEGDPFSIFGISIDLFDAEWPETVVDPPSLHVTENIPMAVGFDYENSYGYPVMVWGSFTASCPEPYHLADLVYEVTKSNNVCKVHGVGTNDTRRLVTDQAAGLGQCLSAIDRTFARMDASVSEGVERDYLRTIRYESEPQDITATSFKYGIGYVDSEVMFSGFSVTDDTTNDTTHVVGGRDHVYAGCSKTSTSVPIAVVGARKTGTTVFVTAGDVWDALIGFRPGDPLEQDYDGYVEFNGGEIFEDGVECVATIADWTGSIVDWKSGLERPYTFTVTNVQAVASYSRGYAYGRTRLDSFGFRGDVDDKQIIYPGDFTRVREATLWHIDSRLREAGSADLYYGMRDAYVTSLSPPEKRFTWSVQQRAVSRPYARPDELSQMYSTLFYDCLTECDEWVSITIGAGDYRIPGEVVPMAAGDVSLDGNVGLSWDDPEAEDRKVPVWEYSIIEARYHVVFPKGSEMGDPMYVITDDGKMVEAPETGLTTHGMIEVHVEGDWGSHVPPEERGSSRPDSYGARANVKVSGLSRVDWDWGALRRED